MISRQEIPFSSVEGKPLIKLVWRPEGTPKAVVQLVHGMAEHIRRYDEAAAALAQAGYLVVGHNLLGHGETAKTLGHFADRSGWDALLMDIHAVRTDLTRETGNLPYFLLGHSMGSFLVRCYLFKYAKGLKGAILSGTGDFHAGAVTVGLCLSRLFMLIGQRMRPAKTIDALAFAANNKAFAPSKTPFDWLSRDEEQVQAYVQDPFCGFVFTASAYHDFFTGLKRLTVTENLELMPKSLPVYFFSGENDPVGQNGQGVRQVAESFRQAGITDVTEKLYPGARHEMFHELNRQEAYEDLIAWLDRHCG